MKHIFKLVFVGLAGSCAVSPGPVNVKTIGEVVCPTNLNSCTAKDVTTLPVSVVPYGGDVCLGVDDNIIFDITIRFQSTADSRYDLGFYLSTDGKPLQNAGPLSARYCLGDAPQIGQGNMNSDLSDCDADLFLGLDDTGHTGEPSDPDTCGDLDAKKGPVEITMRVNVSCSTVTPDFKALIVPSCRVWEQNANHRGACRNISQAGTGSKCDCTPLILQYPAIDPCVLRNCDDSNECTIDTCNVVDGAPVCNYFSEQNKPCDDNITWTSNDRCQNSTCVGDIDPPLNFSCYTRICDLQGCSNVNFADGTSCDDGYYCTVGDVCLDGECQSGQPRNCTASSDCKQSYCDYGKDECVEENKPSGSYCGSDADTECDHRDTCDTEGNCMHNYASNTTLCNTTAATLPCEQARYCDGQGSCPLIGLPKSNGTLCRNSTEACDPPEWCDGVHIACPENRPFLECNDNLTCTVDKCVDGLYCDYSEAVVCYDENACTSNSCTEPNGCAFTTIECSDDGNICHTPVCDSVLGCGFTNNTEKCDDGNACTVNDICGNGVCTPGDTIECNLQETESAECVSYVCNPSTGNCDRVLYDAQGCVSSDPCFVNTTCFDGRCTGGVPLDCDDGHICTIDSCNGGCIHELFESLDYGGCQFTGDRSCIDGVGCDGIHPDCVISYVSENTPCDEPVNFGQYFRECQTPKCVRITDAVQCLSTPLPAGTICREADIYNVCDLVDTCDINGQCSRNTLPWDFVCRNSSGICDKEEFCTGGPDSYCPDDVFEVNKVCRYGNSVCTNDAICDGSSPNCPESTYQTNLVPCSSVNLSINTCQSAGRCSGTNGTCIVPPAENCDDDNSCTIDNCSLVTGTSQAQCTNAVPQGQTCCGCTYTKGYWKSSRFSTWPRKNQTSQSVENTCNWPISPYQCTGTNCTHLENKKMNCLVSNKYVTYWTVMQTSTAPTKTINAKWWLAAQQAIALQLNILNGLCASG